MGKKLDYNSDIPPATQLARMGQAALRERTKKGLHVGPAPIGYVYRQDPELGPVLEIDPVKGPLVAQIFRLRDAGITLHEISRITYALGLRSRHGKQLSVSMINHMLTAPTYRGFVRNPDGELVPGIHSELVQ